MEFQAKLTLVSNVSMRKDVYLQMIFPICKLKQFEALIAVSSVPGGRAAEAELHSGDRR